MNALSQIAPHPSPLLAAIQAARPARAAAEAIIRATSRHPYDAALALAEQLDSIPEVEEYEDVLCDFAERLDQSANGFAADFRTGVEEASRRAYEENGGGRGATWDDPYYISRETERAMEDAENEFVDDWLRAWVDVMVGNCA